MAVGKKKKKEKTVVFTHPPFVLDVAIFVNSLTGKRNATFTTHPYIHMYATLLNNELMNKTKNIKQTLHATSEHVILY